MTLKTYFDIEDGGAGDKRGITFVTGNTEIMVEADVKTLMTNKLSQLSSTKLKMVTKD